MRKTSAATATATTATSTPPKFSVQHGTGSTLTPSWIRSGTAVATTGAAKNASVYGKPRKKRLRRRKVKVNNHNCGLLESAARWGSGQASGPLESLTRVRISPGLLLHLLKNTNPLFSCFDLVFLPCSLKIGFSKWISQRLLKTKFSGR